MKKNNLLKNVVWIALILPFIGFSQKTESKCVPSKWLTLESNEANEDIFQMTDDDDESSDMILVIKSLVESGKLKIYEQASIEEGAKWQAIDYQKQIEENKKDSANIWLIDPYFERIWQSDDPLTDENGDPLIRTNEIGIKEFVYPPIESYVFQSNECDEIRIKESRIDQADNKDVEYVPVGIAFYFNNPGDPEAKERFWVDLNQLYVAVGESNYPWLEALREKRYQGKEYMQIACD